MRHKRKKRRVFDSLAILFLMHSFPGVSNAQTIINTEKLNSYGKEGFFAGLELDIDIERGNSDLVEIEQTSILGFGGKCHRVKLFTGFDYLAEKKEEWIVRTYVQLRHNYHFTPKVRSFAFVQLQQNRSILLKMRRVIGSGIRRVFCISDSVCIDAGTGLMYEEEILDAQKLNPDERTTQETIRMANVLLLTYTMLSSHSIANAIYIQPDIGNLKDIRILNELSFLFSIKRFLQLQISLTWRYDSRPPERLRKGDTNLRFGLIFHV